MLGLLVIYWIGKWHYNLAELHKKTKWLYAILGVLIYYAFTFGASLLIVIFAVYTGGDWINSIPEIALGLLGIPFGIAATWGFRSIMKKQWETEVVVFSEILDDHEL